MVIQIPWVAGFCFRFLLKPYSVSGRGNLSPGHRRSRDGAQAGCEGKGWPFVLAASRRLWETNGGGQ